MLALIKYSLILSALLLEGMAVYKAIQGILKAGGSYSDLSIPLVIGVATFSASYLAFNKVFKGGWWLVALKRLPLVLLACGLMVVTGFTIDTGGKAESIKKTSDNYAERVAAAESDYLAELKEKRELEKQDQALYLKQEQNRMMIVSRLEKEIAHAKKVDAQDAYIVLVEQLTPVRNALPKPEKRPQPTKRKVTQVTEVSDLDYLGTVQANAYGFLVLVLLLLAAQITLTKDQTIHAICRSWRKSDGNLQVKGSTKQGAGNHIEVDPFGAELIPQKEDDGSVSVKAIEEFFGVGYRVAVKKRSAAVTAGYMYKESNLYFYASRPRQTGQKATQKNVDYNVFPSSKQA